MPRLDQPKVLRWRAVAISNDLTHVAMLLDAGAESASIMLALCRCSRL